MMHLQDSRDGQPHILSAASIDLMHTYDQNAPDGWHLGFFGDDVTLISNGSIGGANAHLRLKPQADVAIVCLTNKSTSLADVFAEMITSVVTPNEDDRQNQARNEYMAKYETPYEKTDDLLGDWIGSIKTRSRHADMMLHFDQDGSITARIDGSEPVVVTRAVYNTVAQFKGSCQGSLPIPEAGHGTAMTIRLKLLRDGSRLSGYASAIFSHDNANYSIPSFVNLRRR